MNKEGCRAYLFHSFSPMVETLSFSFSSPLLSSPLLSSSLLLFFSSLLFSSSFLLSSSSLLLQSDNEVGEEGFIPQSPPPSLQNPFSSLPQAWARVGSKKWRKQNGE